MNIETYHTLYIVFLVLAIIFFVISIILFFVFDIRKIISIKSGYAIKQSIKETNEMNQREDNKRRKKYKGSSIRISSEELISEQLISGQLNKTEEIKYTQDSENDQESTTLLVNNTMKETEILDHKKKEEKEGTVVLGMSNQITAEIVTNYETNLKQYVLKEGEFFDVIETMIVIPSENIIRI